MVFDKAPAYAVRRGELGDISHFSEPGSSTYFDAQDAKKYTYADAKIAHLDDKMTAAKVIEEAKKTATPEELSRLKTLEIPGINYVEVEELGLLQAAQRLGYDGARFWENDDVTHPSTVAIWNKSKIKPMK